MKRENIKNTNRKVIVKKGHKKRRHISIVKLFVLIIMVTLVLLGLYFVAKNSILAMSEVGSSVAKKVQNMREENNIENFKKVETINIENKQISQKEMQEKVMSSVEKIMKLPQEDLKVFGKVTDAETLISQAPVFKGTKIGDYIIAYTSIAIIYDESTNKIVKTIALK